MTATIGVTDTMAITMKGIATLMTPGISARLGKQRKGVVELRVMSFLTLV